MRLVVLGLAVSSSWGHGHGTLRRGLMGAPVGEVQARAGGRRPRSLVVSGLAVSSSWGNGHATLWRGLIGALVRQGHEVVFFERDVPWYRDTRDLHALPEGAKLVLYPNW